MASEDVVSLFIALVLVNKKYLSLYISLSQIFEMANMDHRNFPSPDISVDSG